MLEKIQTESVLVFTRTKHRAKTLDKKLAGAGYRSASLQGNLSQGRRQAALDGFKNGTYKILVATDIAARGIDVTRISHVINYDIPSTPDAYIHRIGRTGRAARRGEAFTLITHEDRDMVRAINRIMGSEIEQRTIAALTMRLRDRPAVKRPGNREGRLKNIPDRNRPAPKNLTGRTDPLDLKSLRLLGKTHYP